ASDNAVRGDPVASDGDGGAAAVDGASSGEPGAGASSGEAGSGTGGAAGKGGTDLNADEYTEDSFGYLDERAADFHPLDARETALLRVDEIAIVGVNGAGVASALALDDAAHTFAELGASPGEELASMTIFDVKAANVDDDGSDELVAVGTSAGALVVRVVDSNAEALFDGQDGFTLDDAEYKRAWIETADIDNDGRSEILLAAVTSAGVELRLHDDRMQDYAGLGTLLSLSGAEEIVAAMGNFDDDRWPEFAVLLDTGSDLELRVLDDVENAYSEITSRTNEKLGIFDAPFVVTGLQIVAG